MTDDNEITNAADKLAELTGRDREEFEGDHEIPDFEDQEIEFDDETGGLIGGGIVVAENYRNATGGELYEYVPIRGGGPKYYKYVYVWTAEGYTMDTDRSRVYINGLVVDGEIDEPTRD